MTEAAAALTPGQVVLHVLGQTLAARELEVDQSTVWRWAQDKPRGTGGVVPARYHVRLIEIARANRKRLTAADLVHGRKVAAEA